MTNKVSSVNKPIRDVAAAIIQDEAGRVLLLQRGATAPTYPNHWGPVTGFVDEDETPAQAAVREIAEELGLVGRVLRAGEPFLVDVGRFVARVHPFLCALDGAGTIQLADENQRWAWVAIPDALTRQTIPRLEDDFRALRLL